MGAARFDCSPLFSQAYQDLTDDQRKLVGSYARDILAAPLGPSLHIRELPPMHQPGTMQASCGQFLIRYIVQYDDADGGATVTFIKLIDRTRLYRR